MFRRLAPETQTLDEIRRVEDLVRDRFRVPGREIVLVSEDPGARPGFPPRETNVVFWKDARRYRLKIFSPLAAICGGDLPVAWLLPSLEDNGESDCC